MKSSRNPASMLLCAFCVPLLNGRAISSAITIATVPVGNVNNPSDPDNGFGIVGYEYNIGIYDVTANQYCAFLNAVAGTDTYGIYHPNMAGTSDGNPGIQQQGSPGSYTYNVTAGRGNYPVTDVDFWNATRFANWLDNGQPTGLGEGKGTTETGTYDLFDTSMDQTLATYATYAQKDAYENNQADDYAVVRAAGAAWAVTSQNEWYKAAYYSPNLNPNAPGGSFYQYPVQSPTDTMTASQGNLFGNDTTPVGSYPYTTYAGTYDQGGDVYQWNETQTNGNTASNTRDERGGAFDDWDLGRAESSESIDQQPWEAVSDTGFRVVQLNTFTGGGLLNISNKSVILPNPSGGAITNIMAQLRSGCNNGSWNGTSGITSSTAAADTTHRTAVGVILNDTGANAGHSTGTALFTTLDGSSTSDGDILIKYTYYGDANLDGKVDGSDYSLIDNGYLQHLTGWYNGDFNYDGVVNGSDYTLIDNTFNTQGSSLAASIASPTAETTDQIASPSTGVPEPSALTLLGLCSASLLRRRRCR